MRPLFLLPFALAACSAQSATDNSARSADRLAVQGLTPAVQGLTPTTKGLTPAASRGVEHNVSGSAIQRIGPGFEYSTNVSVRADADGRVSGQLTTRIIDLSAYGYPGQATMHAEPTCMRVVGNTAWIGAVVTRSSDPVAFPVGSLSVFWVRDGGAHGADVGHAGPSIVLDPGNLICTSTPPDLPQNAMTTGNFVVR